MYKLAALERVVADCTHMAAASSLMQEERPYGAREGLPGTVVCVRAGSEMGTRNHTHLGLLTAALLSFNTLQREVNRLHFSGSGASTIFRAATIPFLTPALQPTFSYFLSSWCARRRLVCPILTLTARDSAQAPRIQLSRNDRSL